MNVHRRHNLSIDIPGTNDTCAADFVTLLTSLKVGIPNTHEAPPRDNYEELLKHKKKWVAVLRQLPTNKI